MVGHCSTLSGDSVMSFEHGSPVQNSISDSAATALLLPLLSNAPLPSSSIFYQACTFEECNSPLNFYLLFALMHSFICLCVGVYACVYVWGCGHARAPMWRPEDNLQKLGLFFQRVGPRNWTPVKLPLLSAPLEFARFSCVCFCFLVFHWASALLPRKRHGWQCAFSEDHIWRPPTVCSSLTWWVCFVYPMSYLIPILCKHWTLFPFLPIKKKSMGDILLFYFSQNSLFSTCWALPGLTFHPQHFCTLGRQSSAPPPPSLTRLLLVWTHTFLFLINNLHCVTCF